jgi:hypothetical protein
MNLYQIKEKENSIILIEYLSEKRAAFICALLNDLHDQCYVIEILEIEENQ